MSNKGKNASNQTIKNVIMDVDVGTDDAWAIFLMLDAERRGLVKLKAITCIHGNSTIDNIGRNVIRLLEAVNRTDIPVYLGCGEPIIVHNPEHGEKAIRFHGHDGLCDLEYDSEPDVSLIQKEHAVNAIHEIISSESNVTVMCLGPLTNLALLEKLYPLDSEKLESIWLMGGNRHGVGNVTRAAEYNFYCDPEAAFAVFQSTKCPIYMLPLETARVMKIPLEFRLETLASFENGFTKFMNIIERKAFKDYKIWVPYDAIAAACFIDATIIESIENWHVKIELGGFFARGQVILDHNNVENAKNAQIIESVNLKKFQQLTLDAVKNFE